jgi:hypothetical protein
MAATEVEVRPQEAETQSRLSRRRAAALVALVWAVAFLLAAGAHLTRDAIAGDRFDLVRWQRETMWNKWLFHAGAPLRDDVPAEEALRRYFMLSDRHSDEARALESTVEREIERRIETVLREQGLNARGIRIPGTVFPPVAIELATPPRVLVESPRSEIRRLTTTLLRTDLIPEDVREIEQRIEVNHDDRSALVVGAGGLATYPAVVNAHATYERAVATAAHEWVHHYLVFYPLGIRYFQSRDLELINETVADVIGFEVADLVLERWGDPTVLEPPFSGDPAEEPVEVVERFNYFPVLRDLRIEVDLLLLEGRVEEAEARMAEVREELRQEGIFFRRINQAFFAWHGSYAARPDAVDPLGPQIIELRNRAGTLDEFVRLIRGVTSRTDVVELLESLRLRDGVPAGGVMPDGSLAEGVQG